MCHKVTRFSYPLSIHQSHISFCSIGSIKRASFTREKTCEAVFSVLISICQWAADCSSASENERLMSACALASTVLAFFRANIQLQASILGHCLFHSLCLVCVWTVSPRHQTMETVVVVRRCRSANENNNWCCCCCCCTHCSKHCRLVWWERPGEVPRSSSHLLLGGHTWHDGILPRRLSYLLDCCVLVALKCLPWRVFLVEHKCSLLLSFFLLFINRALIGLRLVQMQTNDNDRWERVCVFT